MNVYQLPLGPLQTNCYIVSNDVKEAVIFDPGEEADIIFNVIEENKLKPLAILLTHAHFDHIGAVDEVRDEYNIPVYIHKYEADWLTDGQKNGSASFLRNQTIFAREADHVIEKEGKMEFGQFTFSVFETPGHSPGSISFYNKELRTVFSGDALFQRSIGRTDLTGGDHELLIKSIKSKLLSLPDDVVVCSGHGPTTTIGEEKKHNPFF
ncbi:MBL fold metallo-hydrolase [Gottfriedia solisilvae]|uniref:Hydroxyacylglutathione hydrolase n=1 Tax=Gottfriedia solisilvae TaxID=1516104 RepID=A0A8J3EWH3_9BACI|nr:MBL fold metallo-hydrolase [Gottfriedia solisilvae]GGI11208.1 hydroxyacylglutathione hydrolase [Gottfriedia solisilvae]